MTSTATYRGRKIKKSKDSGYIVVLDGDKALVFNTLISATKAVDKAVKAPAK